MKKKYSTRTLKMIENYINNLQPFDERHSDVVSASPWFKTEGWQMIRIVLRSTSVSKGISAVTFEEVIKIDHNKFYTHMEIFTADGYRIHEWGHYDMTLEEAEKDLQSRSNNYFAERVGFEYNFESDYYKAHGLQREEMA